MAATAQGVEAELRLTQQRLVLSEQQASRLAEGVDKLKAEMEAAMANAQARIAELEQRGNGGGQDRIDLVDIKNMDPGTFGGGPSESWKVWSKKVKAYTNARFSGFRAALEWAEAEVSPIDAAALTTMQWQHVDNANARLHDMLILKLKDDPLIKVENHPGSGFAAWQALSRHYDPIGEQFTFDRMTNLMRRAQCKDITELPGALEKWRRDLQLYEAKTGKTVDKDFKTAVLFEMIPAKHYTEIRSRWKWSESKDIMKFLQEVIEFSNEIKHEYAHAHRGKGPAPMDVDALNAENAERAERAEKEFYDAAYWGEGGGEADPYYYPVDWMGKGGKGGKKGGKGGKKGGKKGWGKFSATACNFCGKEGHKRAECRTLAKWKAEMDEERKKKGLPAFVPYSRPVAAVDPEKPPAADEPADYVGFDFDAGALEWGADALEEDHCGTCCDDDGDDGDYELVTKRKCRHHGEKCRGHDTRNETGFYNGAVYWHAHEESSDEEQDAEIDMLDPTPDPWSTWLATGTSEPQATTNQKGLSSVSPDLKGPAKGETFAAMIARERQELEDLIAKTAKNLKFEEEIAKADAAEQRRYEQECKQAEETRAYAAALEASREKRDTPRPERRRPTRWTKEVGQTGLSSDNPSPFHVGQTGLSSDKPSLVHSTYKQVGGSQLDPNTFKGNYDSGRAGLSSVRPATPDKDNQIIGQTEDYHTASPPGLAGNRNQVGLSSVSPNMIADQLYINPKSTHDGQSSDMPPHNPRRKHQRRHPNGDKPAKHRQIHHMDTNGGGDATNPRCRCWRHYSNQSPTG